LVQGTLNYYLPIRGLFFLRADLKNKTKHTELWKNQLEKTKKKSKQDHEQLKLILNWNLQNSPPISLDRIDQIVDDLIDYHFEGKPETLSENLKTSVKFDRLKSLYKFNKNFADKYGQPNAKKRIKKVELVIKQFFKNNPILVEKGINKNIFINHMNDEIICLFAGIFNSEYLSFREERIEHISRLQEESKILKDKYKKYVKKYFNYVEALGDLVEFISNMRFKGNQSFYKQLIKALSADFQPSLQNEYLKFYSNMANQINFVIASGKYVSGGSINSRWSPLTYFTLMTLCSNIKNCCRTSIFKVGKLLGQLSIEFGIFPEGEIVAKKNKILTKSFPDIKKVTSLTKTKIYEECKKDGLSNKVVDDILENIEDQIAEQFAESFKRIYNRNKQRFK
jgi:hypothetical protein